MSNPRIRGSRTNAETKIQSRIDDGEHLIERINQLASSTASDSVQGIDSDFESWSRFNAKLLLALFDDTSLSEEYVACGGPVVMGRPDSKAMYATHLAQDIGQKLRLLRSIVKQLELFEETNGGVPNLATTATKASRNVFIVHGHDDHPKEAVARLVAKLGLNPIILHEQPNRGRTIIEKVEAHADACFAIVILTPDDTGCVVGETPKPRARQNVILELGYFIGRLGRHRVCALKKGDIELPSDFSGVLYRPMDEGQGWRFDIAKEMKAAGIDVDLNNA